MHQCSSPYFFLQYRSNKIPFLMLVKIQIMKLLSSSLTVSIKKGFFKEQTIFRTVAS